jgi:hypothetical protein
MHILIVTVIGLVALAVFFVGASLIGRGSAAGASLFIWVWLVASILNGVIGVVRAGIPVVNEIGALIPIFGIPAAVAWFLASRGAR